MASFKGSYLFQTILGIHVSFQGCNGGFNNSVVELIQVSDFCGGQCVRGVWGMLMNDEDD